MKIAALQMNIFWEDRSSNYNTVKRFAEKAVAAGVDTLVLPEMFSTGFSLNPDITAETEEGPTTRFVKDLARTNGINVIAGVAYRAPSGKVRNCALVVDKSGVEVTRYAKMQLFSFAGEHRNHEPGDGPVTFTLDNVKCTVFICYDLRFPSLFRSVNNRAEVCFVIASWPRERQRHFDILLSARAVENQMYVVGVNRVGDGGGLSYTGGSRIIGPEGNDIADAKSIETLITGDIDTALVKHVREKMPFIEDRRHPPLFP